MKIWLPVFWLATGIAMAGPVAAATYEVRLEGMIASQINPGTDPNLAVGDRIVLTARFDSARLTTWGNSGYMVAGLYGLPTSGAEYFRVDAPGMTWSARDDQFDGLEIYSEYLGGISRSLFTPAIVFTADKVLGASSVMLPSDTADRAPLTLGSWIRPGLREDGFEQFHTLMLSDSFAIEENLHSYGNMYETPGFQGFWDFAGSQVAAVPEPAMWGMMITGFALTGAALRRRRSARQDGIVPASA